MSTSERDVRPGADAGPDEDVTGSDGAGPPVLLLMPSDLTMRLERTLERYCQEHALKLVEDHRRRCRRGGEERRAEPWPEHERNGGPAVEQRRIRNADGRRVAERRATLIPVLLPGELPRRAQVCADRLICADRIAPSEEHQEDWDTARLVTRFQAGDTDVFSEIYMRYFDRLYGYLRIALRDGFEAEDATQQVFLQAMEALNAYELRSVPFRAWLFRIVRNYSINHMVKRNRVDIEDPRDLDRRREVAGDVDPEVLEWFSDKDLMILVGRLPLAQRQVLMLRYMMDLSAPEIAEILDRSPDAVRQLHQRAITYLRARMAALGRTPEAGRRRASLPMRQVFRQAPVLRARRFAVLGRIGRRFAAAA